VNTQNRNKKRHRRKKIIGIECNPFCKIAVILKIASNITKPVGAVVFGLNKKMSG